jgi:hypothetical protein
MRIYFPFVLGSFGFFTHFCIFPMYLLSSFTSLLFPFSYSLSIAKILCLATATVENIETLVFGMVLFLHIH